VYARQHGRLISLGAYRSTSVYNVLDAGSVGVSSNIDDQPHLITGDL